MDNILMQFLTFGAFMLGCATFILTYFIRKTVEISVPSLKKNAHENSKDITYKTKMAEWWNSVILYAIPVVIGCLFGLTRLEVFFSKDTDLGSCIVVGGVTGWFASYLYKIFNKLIAKKTGVEFNLPS